MKADQRARRRYLGGRVPYGWRVSESGELTEEVSQQQALREMKRLRQRGLSLRAISAAMREAGYTISHEGIAGVLRAAGAGEGNYHQGEN